MDRLRESPVHEPLGKDATSVAPSGIVCFRIPSRLQRARNRPRGDFPEPLEPAPSVKTGLLGILSARRQIAGAAARVPVEAGADRRNRKGAATSPAGRAAGRAEATGARKAAERAKDPPKTGSRVREPDRRSAPRGRIPPASNRGMSVGVDGQVGDASDLMPAAEVRAGIEARSRGIPHRRVGRGATVPEALATQSAPARDGATGISCAGRAPRPACGTRSADIRG